MHRTPTKVLLIVAAFALFIVPVAAIAAAGFEDVADDNVFKTDIEWLADAEVTKGCNPPTNTRFCPGSNVTREQMAAFMHRLATNKVVDAATAIEAENSDTLDGKDSAAFALAGHNHDIAYLAKTGKAADSDKLDGKDSTAFLGTTGKAADSDKLDGKDSTAFVLQSDLAMPQALWAGGETDDYWTTSKGTVETLRTLSLTPPVDGKVVANASLLIVESTASDYVACWIAENGSYPEYAKSYWMSHGDPFGNWSGTRGFDVVGGVPVTFDFQCVPSAANTSPDTDLRLPLLTAIYVPNT